MLATRIIPTLLHRKGRLVKGECFNAWRTVGHALQAVRIHQARGVDELVLLDVGATLEHRSPDLAMVEELTRECFSPLAVGGGIRTVQDVRDLLKAGADKVVVGSAALERPALLAEIADAVGSQALVVAIDAKDGCAWKRCATQSTRWTPLAWAIQAIAEGAGEILLTTIERDGTMAGYDLQLLAQVASAVHVPVIASGGCSGYEDMAAAVAAGASAVAAGALFQFTDATPRGAAQFLAEQGIEARV